MRKFNKKAGKIAIGTLGFVTAFVMVGAAYLFVSPADALALQNRKDTLQTSAFSTLSQHVFVFTTQTALTTDSLATADFSFVLNFPVNAGGDPFGTSVPNFVAADVTATCTSCGSQVMAVTDVEESSNGGAAANDEFLVAINETGVDSAPLPAASIVTLTFGAATGAQRLTNPANDAAGCTAGAVGTADICRITIQTSEAITGATPATVDNGDVLVALIEGVAVSASISESLSFSMAAGAACTGDTGTPTGISATATTVPFGALSVSAFKVGCQDLTVATNAASGYSVTSEENTQLKDAALPAADDTIPDTTCDTGTCTQTTGAAWATASANQGLGYWCENITGTPCVAAGDSTAEHRQFACRSSVADDCTNGSGESAVAVLTGTSPINNVVGRVHYKISISATEAAGSYSNTITYIATGTF